MTVSVGCPNCRKKYSLKETLIGRKAKCICGCVFRINGAGHTAEEKTTDSGLDAFETYHKQESSQKIPSEPVDSGLSEQPRYIVNERSMATEVLIRLAYGSPGLIVVAIYVYCKNGLLPALFATLLGTIAFCIVMYKGVGAQRERAAERGMSFEQYQRGWRGHKATSPKLKLAQGILCCSCILLLWLFVIPDEWATKLLRPDFAFAKHWKMGLLILVLNFPVLLFMATWLMGGWRKYLSITGRLFLWERLPFHYFFKGYWRTFTEMSREELFGWAATDMLYIWICLLEYLVIKTVFFSL